MLTYTNVLTGTIAVGATITGATSGATAYVVSVQAEPKTMYIIPATGTFQAGEVVSDGSTSATLDSGGSFIANQDGRLLVTTFAQSAPEPGDSLQFATTDGNAYQIQTVSAVTVNSVAYQVIVFSTSRPTPVAENVVVNVRKEFSLVRLTGHDFLMIGTGDATTTNWPDEPTQPASQADQIITNTTDPGRVYYVATDEMGNFYVGDQFKVDQATGKVTLDSSAFDLKGLESLQLGSIGGLIGASINEFTTDGTFSQNSDVKVPTQAAVKTYVDTVNNINPTGGTLTVAGNLTITGTTTTVNSTTLSIADNQIDLRTGNSITAGNGGMRVVLTTDGSGNIQTSRDIRWNNSVGKWQFTEDGTAYKNMGSGGIAMSYFCGSFT